MIATCAERKSLSPKVISSVAVVSFSLTTGTTCQAIKPLQRLTRVQVVDPLRHVEGGQQHLRGTDASSGEPILVGAEEVALADGRGGLELVDCARALGESQQPPPPGDRARGDHQHLLAAGVELADLAADLIEDVGAQRSVRSGDDR